MTAGNIYTIAGDGDLGLTGDGGAATSASVSTPSDVTYGADGYLKVLQGFGDYTHLGIRTVDASDEISTVAGSTSLSDRIPWSFTSAPDGSLYFNANGEIGRLLDGTSSLPVDEWPVGSGGGGIAVDGDGDVYVGAGGGLAELRPDGSIVDLYIGIVCDFELDSDGGITFTGYYTGSGGDCTGIGRINANDSVTQLASNVGNLGGIAVDNSGDVFVSGAYVTDGYPSAIDELNATGTLSRVAGDDTTGFSGDGGPAADAELDRPMGLTIDNSGDLYVADSGNNRVREIVGVAGASVPRPESGPQPQGPVTYVMPPSGVGTPEGTAGGDPSGVCTCVQQQVTLNPVNSASGEFWHTFTDLSIPGRGPAIDFTRAYSSNMASIEGPFGYGWSSSYSMNLSSDSGGDIQVTQENGSQVVFTPNGDGTYSPAQPRVLATLSVDGAGDFVFTRKAQQVFTFNPDGQLTAISDLNGETTTLSYDDDGYLSAVTDAAGRTTTVSTSNGLVTALTDPAGRTISYTYDSAGDLTSVTDPDGATWTFGYDANHRLTTMLDPNQQDLPSPQPLTNVYDEDGRVIGQTDYAGRTTTFAYTGDNFSDDGGTTTITDPRGVTTVDDYTDGELSETTKAVGTAGQVSWDYTYDPVTDGRTSVTDPLDHVRTFTYDSDGNQTSGCDALNDCTATTYNSLNEPLTVTDPAGNSTTNTYDSDGNLLTTAVPLSASRTATTTYTYGDASHPGDVTAITNPRGKISHYVYDSYGEPTSATDPDGNITTYSYTCTPAAVGCRSHIGWAYTSVSPRGNITGGTPAQYTTSYTYDDDGHQLSVTDPSGHVTSSSYDGDGNLASTTDAQSHTTTYHYDADNEPTGTTDAASHSTSATYTDDGQLKTSTDANGNTTSYTYDALGDRTSVTTPPTATNASGETTSYTYDAAGNLTSTTQPAAGGGTMVTTKGYDNADRLTSIDYDGTTPDVTYHYDTDSRRISMHDGTGTTTYNYNLAGWLNNVTDGAGHEVQYAYSIDGKPSAVTYPNGDVVTRAYDNADQLSSVTDWNSHQTQFGYDPDGDLTTITYPNGVTETSSYNRPGTLHEIKDTTASATLADYVYSQNNNNALTGVTATGTSGGPTESYTYDALHRISGYTTSGTHTADSYDNASNITSLLGTSQSYDDADELTSSTSAGVTTSYSYDPRLERITANPSGGSTQNYSYDQAQRLISYSGGSTTASYTYNGDGQRATKSVGGTLTGFTWDPVSSDVSLMISDGTTNYIYGPNDLPIEQTNTSGTAVTYIQHDQQGSTRLITNATGAVTGTYAYTPYGATLTHTGASTPLRYDGQYQDDESNLYYLRARYYDPKTTQFLTRDPLEESTGQPYGYARNDPLTYADPSGMVPCFAGGSIESPDGVVLTCNDITESPESPVREIYFSVSLPGIGCAGEWSVETSEWTDPRTQHSPGDRPVAGPFLITVPAGLDVKIIAIFTPAGQGGPREGVFTVKVRPAGTSSG